MSNYEFLENDFELIQSNKKIADKKLETKPTTFFKDALRRFVKNKASVAGFFILGTLFLLAIFVPIFSNKNIDKVSTTEKFLAPKVFETGTGWWDGTRKYSGIVYDVDNEVPANYVKAAVISCIIDENPTLIDQASPYGHNGYVMFETDKLEADYLQTKATNFDKNNSYKVKVALINEEDVLTSKLGEYRVVLKYKDDAGNEQTLVLKDWSKDYSDFEINISDALNNNGLTSVNANFRFEVKNPDATKYYILIKSVEFSCNENAANYEDLTQAISFTDATQMVVNGDKESIGYWSCSGRKGVHNSELYYCSFVYDTYEVVYGEDHVNYFKSDFDKFTANGWCTLTVNADGTFVFEKLSDECPIDDVESIILNSRTGKLNYAVCVAYKYHNLGYTKTPKFIFGTDASGFDILKYAFAGLRTSLILGVCTAAFCFTFGLIWGSIEGYFGGNVDLFMERFCEILGGVPWIVIMTLAILHLGNNFFTFFLALCLTGWMGTAGRTRAQFYRFKGREYVLASRTLGASDTRLIFKHVLPNSLGTIITGAVLMIPSTIFSEATLAYLNLGLQGVHAFGVMMAENQQYLQLYPNLVIFPAVVMALMMISFNLFGNGLRDAFNPSLKGSE